jgi:hypothetical protein
MGYVYFICEGDSHKLFKIGRTVKHPKGRLRELQTGNPRKLRVYGWISTPDHVELELWFHRLFAARRCGGEWFKVTRGQLARATNDAYLAHRIEDVDLPTLLR